jgi:hypothetical protein
VQLVRIPGSYNCEFPFPRFGLIFLGLTPEHILDGADGRYADVPRPRWRSIASNQVAALSEYQEVLVTAVAKMSFEPKPAGVASLDDERAKQAQDGTLVVQETNAAGATI